MLPLFFDKMGMDLKATWESFGVWICFSETTFYIDYLHKFKMLCPDVIRILCRGTRCMVSHLTYSSCIYETTCKSLNAFWFVCFNLHLFSVLSICVCIPAHSGHYRDLYCSSCVWCHLYILTFLTVATFRTLTLFWGALHTLYEWRHCLCSIIRYFVIMLLCIWPLKNWLSLFWGGRQPSFILELLCRSSFHDSCTKFVLIVSNVLTQIRETSSRPCG